MTDDYRQRQSRALASLAKMLGSGVFVAGREPEEFFANDLASNRLMCVDGDTAELLDWPRLRYDIDEQAGVVTAYQGEMSRSAIFAAGQGCVILPADGSGLRFTPTAVPPLVPDAETNPWPLGDVVDDGSSGSLETVLDWAFDDERHPTPLRTRGLVICHQGRIVAERYAPGFTRTTRQVSWSAGKSFATALIGVLAEQGRLGPNRRDALDQFAPIEEWKGLDDPRRMIRLRHLLNMSSGLFFRFSGNGDPDDLGYTSLNHHGYVYCDGIDVAELSISQPLEFTPGTYWRYRNCDPLSLGLIVRRVVEADSDDHLSFPQRALFDKISMASPVLETDPWGNFILTGYDWATTRDWARFGLLHLWDGVWKPTDERLYPEGWVGFIRSPAPADPSRNYGGMFWLNLGGRHPDAPPDMYWPMGFGGQVTFIIPSRDVVIARHGFPVSVDFDPSGGADVTNEYLNGLVRRVLQAL